MTGPKYDAVLDLPRIGNRMNLYFSSGEQASVSFSSIDWTRRKIGLVVLGIAFIVLFVPTSSTNTALIDLVVSDFPTVTIYSLTILGVTIGGVGYVIRERRRPDQES